ncbi:MAG TPA: TonB-dependent receptor, partial [Rhizomicrobium sp.]
GNLNLSNFLNAINAVRAPSGQIVCSVTLTNPNSGCIPVNFIGNNPISADQQKYLLGKSELQAVSHMDVLNAEVKGSPFALWAGPVAVDVGADTRQEGINQTADPVSTAVNPLTGTNTGGWIFTNPQPLKGSFRLWEVYGEVFAPLLSDNGAFAHQLDFDGAVRHTDYSTSGGVTTWKAGINYAPFDDQLRFRLTQSADIRAPNISELFRSSSQSLGSVQDPFLGNKTFQVVTQSTGNPDLKPETANTSTIGVVYQPDWLPGLITSIDGYNIHIHGAISSLGTQVMINQCAAGNTSFCNFIKRDPVSQQITSFTLPLLNLNDLQTAGLDFEGDYVTPLSAFVEDWVGNLSLRVTANYVNKYSTTSPGGVPLNSAGGLGGGGGQTLPRWLGNINISYNDGPLTISAQTRWIGGVKYDVTLGPAELAHNYVSDRFYQDLSASYKFDLGGVDTEAYVVVQQLFDSDPPLVPASFAGSATNPGLYDQIGRAYRFGLRVAM